ncbi:MAG: endonuclease/exonuclease/phosphatase family protein [Nodosilinea sp.]
MKIATWNLERAAPQTSQAERQRQWLDRINADIWVLTETNLRLSPGANYQQVASGRPDRPGQAGERWVQIWGRGGEMLSLETEDKARTACALVSLKNGPDCLIYGTVLPWLDSPWRSHPVTQGEAFLAALALQQADWQRLQLNHPNAVLIVAGDFNQDLDTFHYYGSRRNRLALQAALAEVGLACLTAGDHDPVRRLINGQHANTDHICIAHSQASQFQTSFAWPAALDDLRGLSDHFGVGVELSP